MREVPVRPSAYPSMSYSQLPVGFQWHFGNRSLMKLLCELNFSPVLQLQFLSWTFQNKSLSCAFACQEGVWGSGGRPIGFDLLNFMDFPKVSNRKCSLHIMKWSVYIIMVLFTKQLKLCWWTSRKTFCVWQQCYRPFVLLIMYPVPVPAAARSKA